MSDWLHNLPVVWVALVVFGATYVAAGLIYASVTILAVGERARAFKAVSPSMLPSLGILFGLFVAFTAAQVWNDTDRAHTAVLREASALSAVAILAAGFPGEPEAQMRRLIRRHIVATATQEWPMMAQRTATLTITPPPLAEALHLALGLEPGSRGQENAQREIVTALQDALEARRQRIIVSLSQVNLVKWLACPCRRSACCSLSRWSTATTGARSPSQWGYSRAGLPCRYS